MMDQNLIQTNKGNNFSKKWRNLKGNFNKVACATSEGTYCIYKKNSETKVKKSLSKHCRSTSAAESVLFAI